jgi:hypothetical protein
MKNMRLLRREGLLAMTWSMFLLFAGVGAARRIMGAVNTERAAGFACSLNKKFNDMMIVTIKKCLNLLV